MLPASAENVVCRLQYDRNPLSNENLSITNTVLPSTAEVSTMQQPTMFQPFMSSDPSREESLTSFPPTLDNTPALDNPAPGQYFTGEGLLNNDNESSDRGLHEELENVVEEIVECLEYDKQDEEEIGFDIAEDISSNEHRARRHRCEEDKERLIAEEWTVRKVDNQLRQEIVWKTIRQSIPDADIEEYEKVGVREMNFKKFDELKRVL